MIYRVTAIAAGLLLLGALALPGLADHHQTAATTDERPTTTALATFAGGCFWCMEPPYDKLDGVLSTTSGYAGGSLVNPTYRQVTSGRSGHTEVVQIEYDPSKVSYETLLQVFWLNIDPTDALGQFCDKGSQYRSEIFYHDAAQRDAAEASLRALQADKPFPQTIKTQITALDDSFYPAEAYHQDYYQRNPIRYKYYRTGCGRDKRLKQLWGDRTQSFDPSKG